MCVCVSACVWSVCVCVCVCVLIFLVTCFKTLYHPIFPCTPAIFRSTDVRSNVLTESSQNRHGRCMLMTPNRPVFVSYLHLCAVYRSMANEMKTKKNSSSTRKLEIISAVCSLISSQVDQHCGL